MLYTLRFSLQNAVCFIMLTGLVPVLFTFYILGVLKLKNNNNNYGAKGLMTSRSPSPLIHSLFSPIPAPTDNTRAKTGKPPPTEETVHTSDSIM